MLTPLMLKSSLLKREIDQRYLAEGIYWTTMLQLFHLEQHPERRKLFVQRLENLFADFSNQEQLGIALKLIEYQITDEPLWAEITQIIENKLSDYDTTIWVQLFLL